MRFKKSELNIGHFFGLLFVLALILIIWGLVKLTGAWEFIKDLMDIAK